MEWPVSPGESERTAVYNIKCTSVRKSVLRGACVSPGVTNEDEVGLHTAAAGGGMVLNGALSAVSNEAKYSFFLD